MNATDRELLTLAAQVASLTVEWKDWGRFDSRDGLPTAKDVVWNPLDDDGDAMRLLYALTERLGWVSCLSIGKDRSACEFNYACGDDPHANTRRAIVLAAAKTAKAMR